MTAETSSKVRVPDVSLRSGALRVVALLMLVAALGHFNRMSMSVAGAERLIDHEGISPTEMGMVYSGFLLVYTLTMLPGGLLIDRFGPRAMLAVMLAGSAVFVALTGMTSWLAADVTSLWVALLVVRCLMGAVNAPLHPASARLVGHSVPRSQTSLANGLVTFAACVGIASTYFVFGGLMDRLDWPGAFYASSGVTLLVLVAWVVGTAPAASARPETTSANILSEALDLFRHRGLICLTLSYAAMGYVQYLFFYWSQYYFKDVLDISIERSRLYSTFVTLANGVGMVLGGWLADGAMRRFSRFGIVLVPVAGLISSGTLLVAGVLSPNADLGFACFVASMAALGVCEGPSWTLSVAIGGRRGGTAAALMNTGGNAGGLLAPVVTPYLSKYLGWQVGMGMASLVALVGALLWVGIDPHPERDRSSCAP
jgi:MFS family permease